MGMINFPYQLASKCSAIGGGFTTLDGQNEQTGHCAYWTTPDGATRSITHFCWSTGVVTTGDDILVQLETIDAATGFPNGIVAAGRSGTQTVANADDYVYFETALTTPYTLASGSWLAVTLKMTNASKSLQIAKGSAYYLAVANFNWICDDIVGAATWVKGTYKTNIALKCSTGEYLIPMGSSIYERGNVTTNISTATTPQYLGNKIIAGNSARLSGIMLPALDLEYDITIKLVDASGTTIIGDDASTSMQIVVDSEYRAGISVYYLSPVNFPCPKTLVAGTSYYLIFSPDTASNTTIYQWQYESEALKNQDCRIPTGWTCSHCSSPSEVSFTVISNYIVGLLPIFDQIYFSDVGNVTEDDTVNGVTGTYHEATEAEVQSGVTFGALSALTGTYVGGGGGGLIRHPGMNGGLNG